MDGAPKTVFTTHNVSPVVKDEIGLRADNDNLTLLPNVCETVVPTTPVTELRINRQISNSTSSWGGTTSDSISFTSVSSDATFTLTRHYSDDESVDTVSELSISTVRHEYMRGTASTNFRRQRNHSARIILDDHNIHTVTTRTSDSDDSVHYPLQQTSLNTSSSSLSTTRQHAKHHIPTHTRPEVQLPGNFTRGGNYSTIYISSNNKYGKKQVQSIITHHVAPFERTNSVPIPSTHLSSQSRKRNDTATTTTRSKVDDATKSCYMAHYYPAEGKEVLVELNGVFDVQVEEEYKKYMHFVTHLTHMQRYRLYCKMIDDCNRGIYIQQQRSCNFLSEENNLTKLKDYALRELTDYISAQVFDLHRELLRREHNMVAPTSERCCTII